MKNLHSKMLNKGLSILIALLLAVGGIPVIALAENENPADDYTYGTSGVTISGTEDEDSPRPSDEGGESGRDADFADGEAATSGVTQGEDNAEDEKEAAPAGFATFSGEGNRTLYFNSEDGKFYASELYDYVDSYDIPSGIIDSENEIPVSGASWDGSKLTLNNVSWITSAPYALFINNSSAITLELIGSNTFISTNTSTAPYHSAGVLSLKGLTITGPGSLTATGGRIKDTDGRGGAAARSAGIFNLYGALIIENGIINATGGTGYISTGLFGGFGTLSLEGGVVTAEGINGISESNGVSSDAGITMNGGSLITKGGTASSGSSSGFFTWGGTIALNGGIFIASGKTQAIMLASGGKMRVDVIAYSWWHSTNQDGSNAVQDSGSFANNISYKYIRLDVPTLGSSPAEITDLNATDNGDGSITVEFTSDKEGTVYYKVQDSGEPEPDKPNHSGDGWIYLGYAQDDENSFDITGVPSDDKDIYIVVADDDYNVSDPVKVPARDLPSTYSISLTPDSDKDFSTAVYGYGAQSAHSVTVKNSGNQPTGALTVALSGNNASSFTLSKASIASIAVSGNDSFTVTPNTGLAPETYTATVTVSGGNGISKSFGVSFEVTKANQAALSITGLNGPYTYGGTPITLGITGGSGTGAVTYSSSDPSVATVSGNTVTIVGAGSFTITATKAGDSDYNVANVTSGSVAVNPKTITFTATASDKTYDGNADATVTLSTTGFVGGDSPAVNHTAATFPDKNAANGKPVTVSGISLSGTGSGNYTLSGTTANASANITKKDVSINTVAALTKAYNGDATATAGAVTFNGTVDTLTAGTDYTVTAVFTGGNYNAGSSKPYTYTVTMQDTAAANNYNLLSGTKTGPDGTIDKATGLTAASPDTITIIESDTDSHTFDLSSIELNKGDCGTVSYALGTFSNSGSVLTAQPALSGTTLTYQGNGQSGGSATQVITIATTNYESVNVTITFTATAKNNVSGSITFTNGSAVYDGTAKTHETASISGYSGGTWTYSYSGKDSTAYGPSATAPANAGSYTVTAKYEDSSNLGIKTADFTIAPRNISNAAIAAIGNQTYTGSAIEPAVTVTDGNPSIITSSDYTVSYNNNTNVGTATVTLTGQNNYTGTKPVNFNIAAIPLTSAVITVIAPEKGISPTTTANGGANYTCGAVTWSPSHNPFQSSTAYTATVTLTANSGYTFTGLTTATINGNTATVTNNTGAAVTLSYQFPSLPAKTVSGISIKTPPQLTYVAGDKLNLSGLVITVNYDDATTEDIAYNKTGLAYKIDNNAVTGGTTSMSNSKHDGEKLVVSYGGKNANTGSLTVYEATALQIAVSDIDSTSAKLTYSATADSRNTVTSKLQVKSGGVWTDVAGASPPYTASGLSPNTSYEYRIWVQNNTTSRVYAQSVTFRTAESAPAGITLDGDIIDNTNPIAIWVTLEHGNTVISSVQATAKSGAANTYVFGFSNVPDGIFNLVVDNGSWKVTQAVTIVNGVVIRPTGRITIDMSTGRTQSIVDIVTPDTPPAAVGGLSKLFNDNTIYTPADKAIVSGGGTVEIKLAVEAVANPSDARDIDGAASGQTVGLYLDLSMLKSQFDDTGALLDESKLTDLNGNLIIITFELPDDLKGKSNLTIYRVHNGTAEKLPPNPNPFNESVDISDGIVTLNVCKFSTYAIAYTQTSPPNPSSPPTSPSTNGGSSSGGGGSSSPTPPTQWVDESNTKTLAKSATEQGADSVRTSSSGGTGIRKKALQTLGKSGLSYRHDTITGNTVQVRVYVDDPTAATKDILVSGYTSGNTVDKTISIVNKWFSNDVAVISLDQQGDFGMNVRIAALVDLSGLDTSNLYFYSYDKATNKYKLIVTEYRLDSKGYIHFSTVLGGSIIVTDRPLTKIGADAEEDSDTYGPPLTGVGLDNPATGGDGIGMYIPPAKAQELDFATAQTIIESIASDGVLTLKNNSVPAAVAGNGAGNSGSVLKVNLDAPGIPELAQESGGFKLSIGMITGIVIAVLIVAIILWAVIPRKDDELVQK